MGLATRLSGYANAQDKRGDLWGKGARTKKGVYVSLNIDRTVKNKRKKYFSGRSNLRRYEYA